VQAKKVQVTYHAKSQFERLSKTEKDELVRMLTDPDLRLRPQKTVPSGNSVSRLGATKRVVWKLSENGNPLVLSVVEAAAA